MMKNTLGASLAATTDLETMGWQLFNEKKYDKALEVFAQVFQRDAKNIAAFQCSIPSLRKKRDFARAEEVLALAVGVHPNHTGILTERAWLYLEQKQYDEAINAFQDVIKSGTPDENHFIWTIHLLRTERRFEEARKLIEDARRRFPGSLRMRNERGWLHFYQREHDDAIAVFEETMKDDPHNESALQGKIASLRIRGHYAEAARLADDALTHLGDSPGIYSERGWIHFEQGQYERAEADFTKALGLTPDVPSCHINLAWCLVRQGTPAELDEAAKHCRQALGLYPQLPEAFGCLGNIAFKQERIREAEAYFLRSIQVDGRRGHYADLGALYIQIGQYEQARQKLERAIENNPDDAYAHIEMGDLHLRTDAIKEAIREFRLATVIDPTNPDSFKALATGLMENNRLAEAEEVLRNAIRRLDGAKRWGLHLTLCRLLTRLGDETNDPQFYEEALKEAGGAIRLKLKHSAAHFHAGVVRCKLEEYSNALASFRRCMRDEAGEYQLEAEINARRVRNLMRAERARSRAGIFASAFLTVIVLLQLGALWVMRIRTDKISDTMLTVLVPILLGLMVVAVLLPSVSRLKMTGLEAELSEPKPKESLASGPKGEIGFSSAELKS